MNQRTLLLIAMLAIAMLSVSFCLGEDSDADDGETQASDAGKGESVRWQGIPSDGLMVRPLDIILDDFSITIPQGGEHTVKVLGAPAGETADTLVWTSSDSSVAEVFGGVITAVSPGKAVIRASTADGESSMVCVVTVTDGSYGPVAVSGVKISRSSATFEEDSYLLLTATVLPRNADVKSVVWSSSDLSVATVENGRVIAVSEGTAVVTVRTIDGGFEDACVVTVVKKAVPAEPLQIYNQGEPVSSLDLYVHRFAGLAYLTVDPDIGSAVVWSSSDPSVVTVKHWLVQAVSPGNAVVTAETIDGKYSGSCIIQASEPPVLILDVACVSAPAGGSAEVDLKIVSNPNQDVSSYAVMIGFGEGLVLEGVRNGPISSTIDYHSADDDDPYYYFMVDGVTERLGTIATLVFTVEGDAYGFIPVDIELAVLDQNGEGVFGTYASGVVAVESRSTLELNAYSLELETGSLFRFDYRTENAPWDVYAEWSSDNDDVILLTPFGEALALSPGIAMVKASLAGIEAFCTVTVVDHPVEPYIYDFHVSCADMLLTAGSTGEITATIGFIGNSPSNYNFECSSSDESIAVVEPHGWGGSEGAVQFEKRADLIVTAMSEGVATITVRVQGTDMAAQVEVTVIPAPLEKLVIEDVGIMTPGESRYTTVIIYPGAAVTTLEWSSSDENVVTVNYSDEADTTSWDGYSYAYRIATLTAVSPGTATIKVVSPEWGVEGSIDVTVMGLADLVVDESMDLIVDGTGKINAEAITDPEGQRVDLVWSSSDESVVTVDSHGVVTAVSVGVADVIVGARGFDMTSLCRVTVNPAPLESLEMREEIYLQLGESEEILIFVEPLNAVETTLVCYSSDENVVTVDLSDEAYTGMFWDGYSYAYRIVTLTAVSPGTATVRVVSPEWNLETSAEVYVDNFSFAVDSSIELVEGHTGIIGVEVISDPEGMDYEIYWESNDESVAIVDSDGVVTAVSEGSTSITASMHLTYVYTVAYCDVTVVPDSLEPYADDKEASSIQTLDVVDADVPSTMASDVSPDAAEDASLPSSDADASMRIEDDVSHPVIDGGDKVGSEKIASDRPSGSYAVAENTTSQDADTDVWLYAAIAAVLGLAMLALVVRLRH